MATNQNPYADYMKIFSEFKGPKMDMNEMMTISRRNAEAFSAAGSVVAEGMQHISRSQAENIRTSMEEMMKASKDMMVGGSPEINSTKQMELVKKMFETSLRNMRDASETMTKSMLEASDVINKRASESMEEMSSLTKAA